MRKVTTMLLLLSSQLYGQVQSLYEIDHFTRKAEEFHEIENYDSSYHYSKKAFELSKQNPQVLVHLKSGGLYAESLHGLKKYLEALEVVNSLIPLSEQNKHDSLSAKLYALSSKLYGLQFVEVEALNMAEKAFQKYLRVDSVLAYEQLLRVGYYKANIRINRVEEGFADIKKAYEYFITNENGSLQNKASAQVGYGYGLMKSKLFDSSIVELNKVLAFGDKVSLNTIHNAYYYLSWVYHERKEYQKALISAESAYDIALEMQETAKISFAVSQLSQMHQNLKNFEMALKYHNKADSLTGMMIHQDYSREISRLKVKFESEQKQREIDALQYEKALAKRELIIAWISITIMVLLAGFGFTLLYRRHHLHKREMQEVKSKKVVIQKELDHHKSQVATHSLDLMQKEKLIKDIKKNIQGVKEKNNLNKEASDELGRLINKLDFNSNIVKSWEDFRIHFEQAQGDLSSNLAKQYPKLSSHELRLCSLVKSGLTVKEMAVVLNISPQGVKTARYRLRKKLGLKKQDKLVNFLHGVEKNELIEG